MCLWYLWYSSREDSLVSRHTKWNHMLQSLTTKSVDVEKAEIVAVLKPETCRYVMRRHPSAVNLRHMSLNKYVISVCRMFFFFAVTFPRIVYFHSKRTFKGHRQWASTVGLLFLCVSKNRPPGINLASDAQVYTLKMTSCHYTTALCAESGNRRM